MQIERKGMLLVISGPSGAGKGTLAQRLLKEDPSFKFSVSCTTRAPRNIEMEGVHYYFVSDARFDELLKEDAFLEYAVVHGNRYGTLKSQVYEAICRGENILLDIDPQGARRVMDSEKDCVTVFILPPSYKELKTRLHTRNTDDPVEIERRLKNARGEIEQLSRYQYAVVNNELDLAYEQLLSIVTAEKQKTMRFFPTVPEE